MSTIKTLIMSRRLIIIITATVMIMYFSLILFMLNPLHAAARGTFADSGEGEFPYRRVPTVKWCKRLQWRSPATAGVVALASAPGSGNTWLRYLLQQSTGLLTGSVYMDLSLRLHGFPAENVVDGSVLVVKTHEGPPLENMVPNRGPVTNTYKSAILLVRNPRNSILADFNRAFKGHIGNAPKSAFTTKTKNSVWVTYVPKALNAWEDLNRKWLSNFSAPVHIVFYETLVRDTRQTLQGILQFLNYNITEEDMNCAMDRKEGIYRRKNKYKNFDPYTPDMYRQIDSAKDRVFKMITDYQRKHNVTGQRKPPK